MNLRTAGLSLLCISVVALTEGGGDVYVRDETVSIDSTYNLDYVELAPAFLVARFGPPAEGDGLRVSGLYTFISDTQETFTLHDYKSTTLWATDEQLPSVEEFWSSTTDQDISVGGREGTDHRRFVAWLLAEQEAWRKRRP